MGRGSTELIKEAHALIKQETGALVDTSRWVKAIDEMFDRGMTPTDIISALKIALTDRWHRAQVMDFGLVHINRRSNSLLIKQPENTPKPAKAYRELFKAGQHQRWEIANHIFMDQFMKENGRHPTLPELHQYSDRWYAQNVAIAGDWQECPVCISEINLSNECGVDPFRPAPDTRTIIKSIPEA